MRAPKTDCYDRARNKRRALADIIEVTPQSADAILKGSGI